GAQCCRTSGVIAGLDPAIHLLRQKMDARVKPGHDGGGWGSPALPFKVISAAQHPHSPHLHHQKNAQHDAPSGPHSRVRVDLLSPTTKVRGWSAERRVTTRAPREGARRALRSARSPSGAPLVASLASAALPGNRTDELSLRPDPGGPPAPPFIRSTS